MVGFDNEFFYDCLNKKHDKRRWETCLNSEFLPLCVHAMKKRDPYRDSDEHFQATDYESVNYQLIIIHTNKSNNNSNF